MKKDLSKNVWDVIFLFVLLPLFSNCIIWLALAWYLKSINKFMKAFNVRMFPCLHCVGFILDCSNLCSSQGFATNIITTVLYVTALKDYQNESLIFFSWIHNVIVGASNFLSSVDLFLSPFILFAIMF